MRSDSRRQLESPARSGDASRTPQAVVDPKDQATIGTDHQAPPVSVEQKSPTLRRSAWRGQLARTAAWLLLAALVWNRVSTSPVDLDLYHEMSLAREICETGRVPWTDQYSYTPTHLVVVHHEWLFGMVAYLLTITLGSAGILLLKYGLIAGICGTSYLLLRWRSGSIALAVLVSLLCFGLLDGALGAIRAQLVSFLLTGLLLLGFELDRRGQRTWLLGYLCLFPIWLNMHGGAIAGAGIFAAYTLEQIIRKQPCCHLIVAGLLLIPLAAINPWALSITSTCSTRSSCQDRPSWNGIRFLLWAPRDICRRISSLVASCHFLFM